MRAVAIVLLATAGSAAARPVTSPYRCEVTVARAPEDVRAAIEDWVRREPRCTTTLEIRVVPGDGGLYLFARDADGRSRERVVPDAQSVGALVASWAAIASERSGDRAGAMRRYREFVASFPRSPRAEAARAALRRP